MTTNDIDAIRTDYDTREQYTDEDRRKSLRAFLAGELVKHIPALCDEIEQLRTVRDDLLIVNASLNRQVADLTAELEKVRGQLTDTRHRADGYAADLRSLQHGHDTYANENAELRKVAEAAKAWCEFPTDEGSTGQALRVAVEELNETGVAQ